MHRDPAQFAAEVARLAAEAPAATGGRLLAMGLDPGTKCGYCVSWFRPGAPYDPRAAFTVMGQLGLEAGPYDAGAIRFVRLRQMLAAAAPAIVFSEEPKYTPPERATRAGAAAIVARAATAMELLGAFKTTICAWREEHGVPCQGLPIGTLKRRVAGKGNSGKPEMIAGINGLFGVDLDPEGFEATGDDNVADAAAALLVGLESYALGVPAGPARAG